MSGGVVPEVSHHMGHGCYQTETAGLPDFSDLYALVQEKTKTEKENQVYTDLVMLLYDIAEGADSFIWNGHTTVSSNSRFTVMDTHALQETGDNIKRTQYFNILTYDWEQMSRDREERVLLICDEGISDDRPISTRSPWYILEM